MINRDFTQSNRWTKACVLYQIGLARTNDFKLDLIAQMFNPDMLIREVAAWALYRLSESEYHQNVNRLPDQHKRDLNDVIIHQHRLSKFEKVLFFQKIEMLDDIPGITLSYLADISEEVKMKQGETLILDDKVNNDFYVQVSGVVDFYEKAVFVSEFSVGQFIGEMLAKPNFVNTNLIIAKSDVRILKFNKDKFYELLADHVKLADKVLEFA